jgi:hypothetical protein
MIKYTSRDFNSIKLDLINHAKNYFPNTYGDFSEGSVGMMFIELMAYMGDLMQLYNERLIQELYMHSSQNLQRVYDIAQTHYGYKPKTSSSSSGKLLITQKVPYRLNINGAREPDTRYAAIIDTLTTKAGPIYFNIKSRVNMSSYNPDQITIAEYSTTQDINGNNVNVIASYYIKKEVDIYSGEIKNVSINSGQWKKYKKIKIPNNNILKILSVVDNLGNTWYEVDNLAQDIVQYVESGIKKLKREARRFAIVRDYNNGWWMQFGAGDNIYSDDIFVPNPQLTNYDYYSAPVDPRNFMNTTTLGLVPDNLTLYVKFISGNGIESNIGSGQITSIFSINATPSSSQILTSDTVWQNSINSLSVINLSPTTGASYPDGLDEIKIGSIAALKMQNRCVTKEDYLARLYTMDPEVASISKAAIYSGDELYADNNNFSVHAFMLGWSYDGRLSYLSDASMTRIKDYINHYKMISDKVYIRHAKIINIGIKFSIIANDDARNKELILLNCMNSLKEHFAIKRWDICQPISLNKIRNILDKVEGVLYPEYIEIFNRTSLNNEDGKYSYSEYEYQIDKGAQLIYPSIDPSIFELKYYDNDIIGSIR